MIIEAPFLTILSQVGQLSVPVLYSTKNGKVQKIALPLSFSERIYQLSDDVTEAAFLAVFPSVPHIPVVDLR